MFKRLVVFAVVAIWMPTLLTVVGQGDRAAFAADSTVNNTEATEQKKARAFFVRGEAAFNAEHYREALAEFEAGYATVPRPGFLINMGHAQRKLGEPHKARALYQKFLQVEPTSPLREDVLAMIAELDGALALEDRAVAPEAPAPAPAPPVAAPLALEAPAPRETPSEAAVSQDVGPARATSATPIYGRSWFWVAAGAVAAGVGVGIYAALRPAGDNFHDVGTFGALRP